MKKRDTGHTDRKGEVRETELSDGETAGPWKHKVFII